MTTTKRLFVRSHDTQLRGLAPFDDLPPAPDVLDSADYGGIRLANIFPPPAPGTVVMVNALSLFEGDIVTLYWHGLPAVSQPVPPGYNGSMKFHVPADLLGVVPRYPPEGSNTGDNATVNVWYTVYRPLSGYTYTSAIATVTVDWRVPGNPDPDPTTPYVNEHLEPLDLPSPVPAKDLTVSVRRWANAAIGDRLFMSWGTRQFLAATLEDTQGDSGPSVEVTIPWQTINTEGDKPVVTYYILDAVSNHSLWAPSITADVETGERLDAPMILDLDDCDRLDADALAGSPGRVRVRYPAPTAGDVIVLTWTGRTQQGIPLPELTLKFTMLSPPTVTHTFDVPFGEISALVGGTARTSYTVTSIDGTARPSFSAIADVVGTALSLPAPSVREAVDDVIDPSGTATAVVRTDYSFMRPTDRIDLVWRGTPVQGSPVTEQQSKLASDAIDSELSFSIPADKLVAVAGGAVAVSYTVLAAGDLPAVSDTLSLKVGDLVAVTLPAPGVEGASGGQLDLQNASDPIIVRVPANPAFNPATDTVDIAWIGTAGSLVGGQSKPADPAGVVFEVPRSVALADVGSNVNIYYSFLRVDTGQLSKPRELSLTDSGSLPAPAVPQASGDVLDALALIGETFTVRLPMDADVLPTDSVTATVQRAGGAGSYTTPAESGAKGMTFELPAASLATHLGQTVQVFYTRTRTNVATASDLLELRIVAASDSEATLPTPVIVQATANGTVLDLGTFSGNATVTVEPWPLMAAGQRVWLRASGTAENGSTTSQALRVGSPVTSAELMGGLREALPRTFLATLGHQSSLSITCAVTYDQTLVEASATMFPVARFTVNTLSLLLIDESDLTLTVGDTTQRSAEGGKLPYRYRAQDTKVLTVTATTGAVRAQAVGKSAVIVEDSSSPAQLAFYVVTVVSGPAPLQLNTSDAALIAGQTLTRGASGGKSPYSFASSNTTVASVTNGGKVTAKAAGTSNVSVTDSASPPASLSYLLRVTAAAPPLSMDISPVSLLTGGTLQRSATGGVEPHQYTSTLPSVASVSATGYVQALTAGKTIVTVSDHSTPVASLSYTVSVADATPPLQMDTSSVTINGSELITYENLQPTTPPQSATYQRTATGGTGALSWTSTGGAVAVNYYNGSLVLVRNGTSKVTVSDSAGQSLSYNITVVGVRKMTQVGNYIYDNAVNAAANAGGRLPSGEEFGRMRYAYGGYPPGSPTGRPFWTTDMIGKQRKVLYMHDDLWAGWDPPFWGKYADTVALVST